MFLQRLTFQLVRSLPWAGCSQLWPVSGVLSSHACRPPYTLQPTGQSRAVSLPGKGSQLELEELLVPRKMSISPLESWMTARYLLPRLDTGVLVSAAPTQHYQCPPSQVKGEARQGHEGIWDAPHMQCKNVLKIRRRKMNHHKYRKLVKRTRFLRRKIKFERDLKRIWLKAGLKEAPEGWQTPKIYVKNK
ncbi:small ribosomal subunit protein mS38 isoform X2 [Marmota monax]|uniref:small ribosomal subunit protein mS38 isoform X2 n=1 Tax=Marmota monax TaxID=9995 RepID=UPI001EB07161|nr:small ribosomal subunit protein mS38 isoform X2 [Marmota monax]